MGDMIRLTGLWKPWGEARYVAKGRAQAPDDKYVKKEDLHRVYQMLLDGEAVFYVFRNDQKGNPKAPAFNLVVAQHSEAAVKPPDDDMPF